MPDKINTTPWSCSIQELYNTFDTRISGLTPEEAHTRLTSYGKNKIRTDNHTHVLTLLFHQALNPLVITLYVACAFSLWLHKPTEAIFVGTAILINILLGFFQEYKANNAIKKLENYIVHKTRVRRGGHIIAIDSQHVVPGDIVILKQGNRIPADMRIIETDSIETEEAILTGESLSVKKETGVHESTTPLPERNNMLWAGTVVTQGEAVGVVTATGSDTEIGAIATLVGSTTQDKTPLEHAVAKLAKVISLALVAMGILITLFGLSAGFPFEDILFLSIAVIVSAVPESLPIAMSVVLAIGAETLARKKGVVRKMAATETLGSTTLILTDKTGTLTEARLRLVGIDALSGTGDDTLIEASLNIDVVSNEESKEISGRPVEIAIAHAIRERTDLFRISQDMEIISVLPFSSVQKFSAVLFMYKGQKVVSLLGAPDILIDKVGTQGGEALSIREKITAYADTGERILGVVSKTVSSNTPIETLVAQPNFEYKGLIRFRDPVREGVPHAVAHIHKAGVKTVIVTGDHPGTAISVAAEIGVWKEGASALTGAQIEHMTNAELSLQLSRVAVFARVTPAQKMRLVELYSKHGEIVAVTGDGVNDAPALKRAAIGVAMGSGTDVARASADLIVLDDNFETVVAAIFEGRTVLRKMRSVITYLLADSFDELLLVGGSIVMTLPLPITALQILFVKFFSDIFPAMAFTFEKTGAFGHSTRPPKTNLFDAQIRMFTLWRGLLSSSVLFITYIVLLKYGFDETVVRTFIFTSFASYILFLAFSMRNLDAPLLSYKPFSNRLLTLGVIIGFGTIMAAIYTPWLQHILGTVSLPPIWLGGVIIIGIANLILVEVLKHVHLSK